MNRLKYLLPLLLIASLSEAKTFQNSYVSFEVPDDWNCLQEGVAWTCTAQNAIDAREAVIVLTAKVAGPEDNLGSFLAHLKQPKKIVTKVGTPMPSQVLYAQKRQLAGLEWVQAHHLGSEVQDFYTLYLATVKEQLAILVSLSCEKDKYKKFSGVFDRALKTLRITANQQLLFPKTGGSPAAAGAGGGVLGINIQGGENLDLMPPPERKPSSLPVALIAVLVLAAGAGIVFFRLRRKKISASHPPKARPK